MPESARTSDSSREVVVEGILERVTYANEDTAWSVVQLNRADDGAPFTAVGNLLGVRPGENLRLRGTWEMHPRHGEQLRVISYVPIEPSTLAGIERYLGSGLIPGVGKEMAARLVRHFGLETLEVIESGGHRLTEVEGIGRVRSQQILSSWSEQRHVQDVMVFLQSHGISNRFAVRIYKKYGDRAMARVRDNPYCLVQDIPGIGFRTADGIARSLGLEADSPARIQAGLLHQLGQFADQGHLFAPRDALREASGALLEVSLDQVEAGIDALVESGLVVAEPLSREGTGDDVALYLDGLFLAERGIAERLTAILRAPARPLAVDVPRAIEWFEGRESVVLGRQQREALARVVEDKVVVITGGPGTGKTTILNAVLTVLEMKSYRTRLAAPTGRAAKRMQQTTGREALTLHRLLEYTPRGNAFQRDREEPVECDCLVVDEMSMVDAVLFYHLLQAVPDPAKLVLVGDVDQLPAVGPGNVLRDLIESDAVPVVVLDEIFRQAETSEIVLNAHRINAGEFPQGKRKVEEGGDFFVAFQEDPAVILDVVLDLVARRVPRRFGVDAVRDIQVLTPMQKGILGVANLNAELQRLLNPQGAGITRGGRLFRAGDRVMQIRNNYDLELFNGDIGWIVAIDPAGQKMVAAFGDREVTLEPSDQEDLVLAYASSIHKSQGSEYPVVIVPLHTSHYVMLQRNLLYTAVTRGRQLVVLVGSHRAIGRAVGHNPMVERNSRLAQKLRAAGG